MGLREVVLAVEMAGGIFGALSLVSMFPGVSSCRRIQNLQGNLHFSAPASFSGRSDR